MNDPAAPAPVAASEPTSAASLIGGQSAPVQSAPEPTPAPTQLATDPSAPAAPDAKWWAGVDPEYVGMMENKNFSDLNATLKSLKSLEAMRGVPENELLRIAKSEDADGTAAMYDRLGRPATPQDYKFEGIEGVDASADWFRNSSHQNGLNDRQATAMMNDFNAAVAAANETSEASYQQQTELDMADLKKEWGAEFDANGEYAQNAARKFDVSDDQLAAMEKSMGAKGLMNFMAKLGRATSEGSMADGQSDPTSGGLGMTREAAQDAYKNLTADPAWKERYFSKDKTIRTAAIEERTKLGRLAQGDAL